MIDSHRETELREAIEAFFFGFRAFTALPDQRLADRGLGRTHHRLLYFIRREPGISVTGLLGILGITKQAVHGPLRDLEHQGLITSSPAESDRRLRALRVTPTGAELEAALSELQMKLLGSAFDEAGKQAEDGWRTVMATLQEHLDSTAG